MATQYGIHCVIQTFMGVKMSVNPRAVRAVFQRVWPVLLATAAAAAAVSLGGCGGFQSTQQLENVAIKPQPGTITSMPPISTSYHYEVCQVGDNIFGRDFNRCKNIKVAGEPYIETTDGDVFLKNTKAVIALPSNGSLLIKQNLSREKSNSYSYSNQLTLCPNQKPNNYCIDSGVLISYIAVNGKIWSVAPLPFQPGREVSTQTLICQDRGKEHPCTPVQKGIGSR